MTREQRRERMMAAWDVANAKLAGEDPEQKAFAAFCEGWCGGHELGCEETVEMALEKFQSAVKRVVRP